MKVYIKIFLPIIFFPIAQYTFSQNQNVWEKYYWSRVSVDTSFERNYAFEYRDYIPKTVRQHYEFKEYDVEVFPNLRVYPTTNTTQSELSIDVHPLNPEILFAGANSTDWPMTTFYGTSGYWTTNGGNTWNGFDIPPFGFNQGDPAHIIGPNGFFYIGFISLTGGQGISRSTNNGINWTSYFVAQNPGTLADKNHLMVDKQVGSPFENRIYSGWTDFGGNNNADVVIRYSTNIGQDWSTSINLSKDQSVSLDQGINIQTGPNGEVYAVWAVYFDSYPVTGEDAIGFAKSIDGGLIWSDPIYIYQSNNFGIRFGLPYPCPLQIRVNSFPSMAVDKSGGVNDGYIYIVWSQSGTQPAGIDADIVLIRSTDGGSSWSSPLRVNDDPLNNNKQQFFPWCSIDQNSGRLNIVFYDNRNTTIDSTGTFMASSIDGGLTFENFQVSDANYHPKSISGLASGYQGDYIGIASANNKAYPIWMDDRTGNYQAWYAEVQFNLTIIHSPLQNTENLSGPYVVDATIVSQNSLVQSEIKIFWGRGTGNISDSLVMTNISGSHYRGNIPGDGLPHIYNYFIKAVDNQGRVGTAPPGAPTEFFTFEAAQDLIPPVITHNPLSNQIKLRWPVSLSAKVVDNLGVQSVDCEFRINGGAISTFSMYETTIHTYNGIFPNIAVSDSDIVEYRIKAADNSGQNNIAYSPSSGYYSFYIIDAKGKILIVDNDIIPGNKILRAGRFRSSVTKSGASSLIFEDALRDANYYAVNIPFDSLDISNLNDYDVIILTAGLNQNLPFNDPVKRAAIAFYTTAGGKTIVEGGDVGFFYNSMPEVDAFFRRNLLNDSLWVSDRIGDNLVLTDLSHQIFNLPNTISSPIMVNNSGGTGSGARDEVTLIEGKPGVSRIARWSSSFFNGGIIIYSPNYDTAVCRNVFYTFSISQFADQTMAANLIENTVRYLLRGVYPVGVESDNSKPVTEYVLQQNYPNPFNPSTNIRYTLGSRQYVQIKVYDILGNEIATLVNEEKPTGTYEITWHSANLPSGVYFYQLRAESFFETKKMLLLK